MSRLSKLTPTTWSEPNVIEDEDTKREQLFSDCGRYALQRNEIKLGRGKKRTSTITDADGNEKVIVSSSGYPPRWFALFKTERGSLVRVHDSKSRRACERAIRKHRARLAHEAANGTKPKPRKRKAKPCK